MRILSWFGAFVIFAAVAVGTTAVVRSHQHSGPALTAAVAAGPVVPTGTGAPPQTLINKDRVAHGLRPLSWSSCLATIARSNAVRISYQGQNISHTNGPTRDL